MTSRDRIVLFGGAAIMLAAWIGLRGAPKLASWIEGAEQEAAQQVGLLDRARRETANLQALSDSIATLEAIAASLHRLLLMGEEPNTAAFDLIRRLSDTLSKSAAFVEGIDPLPDSAVSGPLSRVSVRANLETDVIGFMEIVRRIEVDSLMGIESVRIRASAPDAPRSEIERLQASVAVSGWYRPTPGVADTSVVAPRVGGGA